MRKKIVRFFKIFMIFLQIVNVKLFEQFFAGFTINAAFRQKTNRTAISSIEAKLHIQTKKRY